MEWKTFGIKGKLASAKHKMLKVLGLADGLGEENSNFYSLSSTSTSALCEPENSLTNYPLEAEVRRAEALEYWRRWLDRPR